MSETVLELKFIQVQIEILLVVDPLQLTGRVTGTQFTVGILQCNPLGNPIQFEKSGQSDFVK